MTLGELQNSGLVHDLHDRYYRAGVRSDDMSSHWREFSARFQIETNAGGQLVGLTGFGFGELRWNGLARRVLQDLCIASHLVRLPQRARLVRAWPMFRRVCRAMRVDPTLDAFRQLCTLVLLDDMLSRRPIQAPFRFLMIGDGFGLLAALIKANWPDAKVVLVDLGQSLLFQAVHLQQAYGAPTRHALAGSAEATQADFVYCPSDRQDSIADLAFDVAVNVASMQEMDASVVAAYFQLLRRQLRPENLFYCCNRESKRLPDGSISAIGEYPWLAADHIWIDEPCPWHQYYLTPHATGRPARLFGIPVPGVSRYDGTHRQKLTTMATNRSS